MELTGEHVLRDGDLVTVHSSGRTTYFVVVRTGGEIRMQPIDASEFEARRSGARSSESR